MPTSAKRRGRRPARRELDAALERRQRAALMLVRHGRMDPEDALRLTVWPSGKLEAPPAQAVWPAELAEEARRLCREGFSLPAIAERLCVSFPTAKQWVWNDAPDGYRRAGERPTVLAS